MTYSYQQRAADALLTRNSTLFRAHATQHTMLCAKMSGSRHLTRA